MESRPQPEQGFRSALSIMRLAKRYCPERLEAACGRALVIGGYSYKNVESILKHRLDQQAPVVQETIGTKPIVHTNVRGKKYYVKGDSHAQRTDS